MGTVCYGTGTGTVPVVDENEKYRIYSVSWKRAAKSAFRFKVVFSYYVGAVHYIIYIYMYRLINVSLAVVVPTVCGYV